MRIRNVIAAFLICIAAEASALSDGQPKASCVPVRALAEKDLAFKAGESLEYVVHYKWGIINSDVGRGRVTLDTVKLNGKQLFHCRVFGKTAKFYDAFFRVREDFNSWFSREGLVPYRFTRDTREGNYFATNKYDYRWNAPEPYIAAELDSKTQGQRSAHMPLAECTYDLPSLYYMARNMDFSKVTPGVEYPMTFAIDEDIYNVHFIWLGREEKTVKNIGTVKTIKFAASLVQGEVFGSDTDMFVWISDDGNRIPICFEAPLKYGVASGYLVEWSGLKYPFSSLTKKK